MEDYRDLDAAEGFTYSPEDAEPSWLAFIIPALVTGAAGLIVSIVGIVSFVFICVALNLV